MSKTRIHPIRPVRSWRRMVTGLLAAILVVLLAFMVWVNIYYNAQLNSQLRDVNKDSLSLWVDYTEMRLNMVYEHLRDLSMTVYSNSDANINSSPLSFPHVGNIKSAFLDKLSISDDADSFFVFDKLTDWFLFTANSRLGSSRTLELKCRIPEMKELLVEETSSSGQGWTLISADGQSYLLTGILVGRYIVGATCGLDKFNILETQTILGDPNTCLLEVDGQIFPAGGSQDWSQEVLLSDGGKFSFSDNRPCIAEPFPLVDGTALLAVAKGSYGINRAWIAPAMLFSVSLLCLALILWLSFYLRRKVLKPTKALLVAQDELGAGNLDVRLTGNAGSSEFESVYASFNNMAGQIQNLRIESYDRMLKIREEQLRMVRAQIKPHFYLNAITTVYNMTYQNRQEDIRSFLQALARYVRYMMNIQSSSVAISEELLHIENYLNMQELRFPNSVTFTIRCPKEAGRVEIPFLMLFTLVENAFKHALDLYKPLHLDILCGFWREEGFSGCRLTVEDNGVGFPQEVLEEYQKELPEDRLPPKEHLGLSNIRHTLQFTYHRQDLLRLSNKEDGGARAEILIPIEEEQA